MKIVLRTDVPGVGHKGDICTVQDGYAGNYLIPRGLAYQATKGSERQAAAMRRSRELKDAKERGEAQAMADRLTGKAILIAARAGEGGKLFGSVTQADVLRAVAEQAKVTLDRKAVSMEPLKTLGVHAVPARPHPEVSFELTIEIVAD
jgi:large subunit ribosomal protein L9